MAACGFEAACCVGLWVFDNGVVADGTLCHSGLTYTSFVKAHERVLGQGVPDQLFALV